MAKKVIYVPSCHSTNLLAEQLLAENAVYEGDVVITRHQTKGKGQYDREWESLPGKNLTLSIILNPSFMDLEDQFMLNVFSSLAVRRTLIGKTGYQVKIKWPNDILVERKKICGILIKNLLKEKRINRSILGIGLNVNQEDFIIENATSLKNVTGNSFQLQDLFSELLGNLEYYYIRLRDHKFKELRTEYHESLFGLNQIQTFQADTLFQGVTKGVDNRGQLIIEKDGKDQKYSLNQIRYILEVG